MSEEDRYINKLEALNYVLSKENHRLYKKYIKLREQLVKSRTICIHCGHEICKKCNGNYIDPYCDNCRDQLCDNCIEDVDRNRNGAPHWCQVCRQTRCRHCGECNHGY